MAEMLVVVMMGVIGMSAVAKWVPQIFSAQRSVEGREEALQSLRALERRFRIALESGSPVITTSYQPNGAADMVYIEISPGNSLSASNKCRLLDKEKPLSSPVLRSAISSLWSNTALAPLSGCINLGVPNCDQANSVPVIEVRQVRNGATVEVSNFPTDAMRETTGGFLCLRKVRTNDFAGNARDTMMTYFVAAHARAVVKNEIPSHLDMVGWQSVAMRIPSKLSAPTSTGGHSSSGGPAEDCP